MSSFTDNMPASVSQALAKLMKKQETTKTKNDASLENVRLKVKIEACESLISKHQATLVAREDAYKEMMEEMWRIKADFIEELDIFNDKCGISSPWWNAQLVAISNPSIHQRSEIRRREQQEIQEMTVQIDEAHLEIVGLKQQIAVLREKAAVDQAKIEELRTMEDQLKQEPYGPEFISIKSKIQKNQEICAQLRTSTRMKETLALFARNNDKESEIAQMGMVSAESNNRPSGSNSTRPAGVEMNSEGKVYRVRQTSTIVYHRASNM